jgi:uncharacterized protein
VRNLVVLFASGACAHAPEIREHRLPSGQLIERATYVGDVREGAYESWYSDGARHASGRYVAGKREGAWHEWHENGRPWLEGGYVAGLRSGPWIEYDYTGLKMFDGTYAGGLLQGPWHSYNSKGGDRETGASIAGKLDGTVIMTFPKNRVEATWRDNKLHGPMTIYDDKGSVVEKHEFRDGVEVKGSDAH